MTDWQNRPLDRVYPVIFIDAIMVKIRDGQVANRPIYVAIGVTVDGERDILGLWAGDGGEGAKFWLQVLTEIKNRGVEDVCIAGLRRPQGPARRDHHDLAADRGPDLRAPPDPQHVPLRLPPRLGRRWPSDLRPVYTAANRGRRRRPVRGVRRRPGAASTRRSVRLWRNAWAEFVPFLDYDVEIRRVICSTNAIESPQRPLPAGGPRPRPLPQRAGRAQVPLPGHPIARPDRPRPGTMGDPLEARPQRLRHHLRRPDRPERPARRGRGPAWLTWRSAGCGGRIACR